MFFVFGPAGQVVRGGAGLAEAVGAVHSAQHLQGLRARDREPFGAQDAPQWASGAAAARSTGRPGALAAYRQAAQDPHPVRRCLSCVRDVMSLGAVSVTPEMPLPKAWRILAKRHLGQAPVVNPEGQVVGLLLRADMAPLELLPDALAQQSEQALAARQVQDVMVSPVPTVQQDTHLRRLARVLLETNLPGLAVTDETGQLLGFVTRSDILRAVVADPPLDVWSGPKPQEF